MEQTHFEEDKSIYNYCDMIALNLAFMKIIKI